MIQTHLSSPAIALESLVATAPPTPTQTGKSFFQWNFVIHKWLGLFAAVWLAILGLTGFFLDHPTWRWQVQNKAPTWLTTQALEKNANRNPVRLLQVDPNDPAIRLAGGPRGLWFSRDGGNSWQSTEFAKGDHPQTFAIEPDPALGWKRIWFATDDGIYVSDDAGQTARAATLHGEMITSLTAGAQAQEMVGVIEQSRVFRFNTSEPVQVTSIKLSPLSVQARPEDVQVSRFMRELHFGTGVADPLSSLLMNDLGGIGMFILSVTGLLYWALPKYWKVQAKSRSQSGSGHPNSNSEQTLKAAKAATKKATILWLFRTHSVTLGIASVLMLIYLSVTGIFVGHGRELGDWMRATRIDQMYLPPAFGLKSWDGRIDAIVAYPGSPQTLSIGNRYGLFTTTDAGQSWTRELGSDGTPLNSAARLRRLGDTVLVPNGMAGPSVIQSADKVSHTVAAKEDRSTRTAMDHSQHKGAGGTDRALVESGERALKKRGKSEVAGEGSEMGGMGNMFMPSDVTRIGENFAWKSSGKLLVTDASGREIEKLEIKQPIDPGVPWFTWFLRLHMGTIFWSEWKWINDLFSVVAVVLSVTGLIRWWRKKWA